MGRDDKKPHGKNNPDNDESSRKAKAEVEAQNLQRLQQIQMADLSNTRMESVLLADFRENYHTVDMDAVEAGRASNQEGTPEWQQAQKDKVKLKAWNIGPSNLADDDDIAGGQYHRFMLAATVAALDNDQEGRTHEWRGTVPATRGGHGRGARGGGAAGSRGRGDRQSSLSARVSRAEQSAATFPNSAIPLPQGGAASNSETVTNRESSRSQARGASRGNLTRRNWHPPVASYVHTLPRAPARASMAVTGQSSNSQSVRQQAVAPVRQQAVTPAPKQAVAPAPKQAVTPAPKQAVTSAPKQAVTPAPKKAVAPAPKQAVTPAPKKAVTPVQVRPSQDTTWAPRMLATPDTFLRAYASTLGKGTARAGTTLPQSHDAFISASGPDDSVQLVTATKTSDKSEKSQAREESDSDIQNTAAGTSNVLEEPEALQDDDITSQNTATGSSEGFAVSENLEDTDNASQNAAAGSTIGSEDLEQLIETDSINEDTHRPADIIFGDEIDEAPVGLLLQTPPPASDTTRDSYTVDLLGLELQPETQPETQAETQAESQAHAEVAQEQAGRTDIEHDDVDRNIQGSNMADVQAQLIRLSEMLPTLDPAVAIARLMGLRTLMDPGAAVPQPTPLPSQDQLEGQTSNEVLTASKDETTSDEASNVTTQGLETGRNQALIETTAMAPASQGATIQQDMHTAIDPRMTHVRNPNGTGNSPFTGSVVESRRDEWTSSVAEGQEVIVGRPPIVGNLQHSEHYPGVYVPPKDEDIYSQQKRKDRIIGEHNRAIGHPGRVQQDQKKSDEKARSSSVKEAESNELSDKLAKLKLNDEGSRNDVSHGEAVDDSTGPADRPLQRSSPLRMKSIHATPELPQIQLNGVPIVQDRATVTTAATDPFLGNIARPNVQMRSTPTFPDNAITRQYTQRPELFTLSSTTTATFTDQNPMAEPQTVHLQASTTQDFPSPRYADPPTPLTETMAVVNRGESVSSQTAYGAQGGRVPPAVTQRPGIVGQSTPVFQAPRPATQSNEASSSTARQRTPRFPITRGSRLPEEYEPSMSTYRRPTMQQLPAWLEAEIAMQPRRDHGAAVREEFARVLASSDRPLIPETSIPNRGNNTDNRTVVSPPRGGGAREHQRRGVSTGSNLSFTPNADRENRVSARAPAFIPPVATDPGAAARAQYGGLGYGGPSSATNTGRLPATADAEAENDNEQSNEASRNLVRGRQR